MSLRGTDGSIVFADGGEAGGTARRTAAWCSALSPCVPATLQDFTLLYAPAINSYKRYQPGSFAPTAVAWGEDNRTCAPRVVGHGSGLRVENRAPGGDVNPASPRAAMCSRAACTASVTSQSSDRPSSATPTCRLRAGAGQRR